MFRALHVAALAVSAMIAVTTASQAQLAATAKYESLQEIESVAHERLYQLGYPADAALAVQRWRNDSGSDGTGRLSEDEMLAILEQPEPSFYAAFSGNPFRGMGIAVRHPTREEAEKQALTLCRRQGGGRACADVQVIPGGQCMFVAGYSLRPRDRRPSRGSYIIAPSLEIARDKALDNCRSDAGPSMASQCKPMLSFCADGSHLERFGPINAAGPSGRR